MSRIRTEIIYPVNDVLVEPEILSRSFAVEHRGNIVEITFPTSPSPEDEKPRSHALFDRFPTDPDFPLAEGTRELFATLSMEDSPIVSVDLVRLSYEQEYLEATKLEAIIANARQRTDPVIAAIFDRLRSAGEQPWLGLTGKHHEPEIWRVLDLDRQIRYPRPAAAGGTIRVVPPEAVLTVESVPGLFAELDRAMALPDALLADARFFEWTHAPEGGTVAVLLAAIASEVRVKAVIRATAGEKAALAELLLSRPRDFSLAARTLFSDVMAAVNGRSLKADNPSLEKDVGSLFKTRNRIAHHGEVPSLRAARDAVGTAIEVARWLEDIVRDEQVALDVSQSRSE